MLVVDCPKEETSLPKVSTLVDENLPTVRITKRPNQLSKYDGLVGRRDD